VGSKAPQLKHLARWLLENPSYDVDPKWAEAMKSKGTLPESLAKQLSKEADLTQTLFNQAAAAYPGLFGLDPSSSKNAAAAAAAAQQFGMNLGMAGMNPLALSNPLFANLASFGMAGLPFGDMYSAFSSTDMAALAAAAGLSVPGLTSAASTSSSSSSKDKGLFILISISLTVSPATFISPFHLITLLRHSSSFFFILFHQSSFFFSNLSQHSLFLFIPYHSFYSCNSAFFSLLFNSCYCFFDLLNSHYPFLL
jgi:hypothetical protein